MLYHNLCFEPKYEEYQNFLSENFQFFVVKFLVYLNLLEISWIYTYIQ